MPSDFEADGPERLATAGILRKRISWEPPPSDVGDELAKFAKALTPGSKNPDMLKSRLLDLKAKLAAESAAQVEPKKNAGKRGASAAKPSVAEVALKRARARSSEVPSSGRASGAASASGAIESPDSDDDGKVSKLAKGLCKAHVQNKRALVSDLDDSSSGVSV